MPLETLPSHLPTLDISRFEGAPETRSEFVTALRKTLFDHGFFYLTGHGVDPQLIADVLAVSKRFFALPTSDKLSIEMVKSPHFRGYNGPGEEHTRGERDWREQLNINTEEEAVAIGPDTPPWKRLFGPNQWPARFQNCGRYFCATRPKSRGWELPS